MSSDIAAKITAVLAPLVGRVLADVSLDLESKRLGKTAETLALEDLDQFSVSLEQRLRLMVGPDLAKKAARAVAAIQ